MNENKKPWACEVLGVEVDEEWEYVLPSLWAKKDRFRLHMTRDGLMLEFYGRGEFGEDWMDATEVLSSNDIFYILEHPEDVIRKRRWTEDDVASAKAVRVLFPQSATVDRFRLEERRGCVFIHNGSGDNIGILPQDIFPSLEPGECVDLDVILEAGNG